MNRLFSTALLLLSMYHAPVNAQTIFVDPVNGKDSQAGSAGKPMATLAEAVAAANAFSGKEPVTIKLQPGLYMLTDKLTLRLPATRTKGLRYVIEAAIMPDDTAWRPEKMPVIQSVSGINFSTGFQHAVGFLVQTEDVSFRGLKFAGNANPAVNYYYPINKKDSLIGGLEVSQCYFSGNRYGAPIQGAVWSQGPNTVIDHCVFYNCKNALLFFKQVEGFSVTNTVIYGAYESAMWVWLQNGQFTFRNNMVANCPYFWVIAPDSQPKTRFEHSQFLNVGQYAGNSITMEITPAKDVVFNMVDVKRLNNVDVLAAKEPSQAEIPGFSANYANGAGLFKIKH
ncbi:right-handed parallel beta-helix repeat-containing protein [Chitinophaga agrisoli]|nr:right-handed parallel beta-helix repeat-containing protein [Chitinophaga agrisoli]